MEKEALAAGVKSFISKPLFPSTLIDAINDCIELYPKKIEIGSAGSPDMKRKSFSGQTILIADDVEINREIMSAVLEDTGIMIDYAENGLMAVSMFKDIDTLLEKRNKQHHQKKQTPAGCSLAFP